MDRLAARHFGPYTVEERIGQGGMGEVFRAVDTRLNRPVAVKLMAATGDSEAKALQRFLREARAASALNHPNIVTIHDVGQTDDGEHYIVQELIDGQTLRATLSDRLEYGRLLEIGRQVARALAAAHAAGIVHRDVKPENVMVRSDGYVKVLDFGLARVAEAESEALTATTMDTAPGTVLGTAAYMAPEQARGKPAGPPADVFSLGVVLYEMAAGQRPFGGETTGDRMAAILSEQPAPITRLAPTVPLVFDELVQAMLAKDPRDRPSAADVVERLHTFQGHDAMVATSAAPVRHTVGRGGELMMLRRAYERVRDGNSAIVAVVGEPGIGKSSLTEDFLAELAAGERPIVARGHCSERLAGAEAYLPLLEALEHLMRARAEVSVDGVIKVAAPTWYMQVAARSEHPSIEDLSRATPVASLERLKRELGALFEDLSRTRPVVVVFEDLHWADVSTIDMINYLAGRFGDMRLLMLVTYRRSEMAQADNRFSDVAGDLRSRGLLQELSLTFLDRADVDRYLALEFPDHRFPPELAELVHARTEGSPLFMADLVRDLRDSGGIAEQDGVWVLTQPLDAVGKNLPESMRSMIARKIDRIDQVERKLLQAASVQGHEFDSATVSEATEMDPADVEDRLEALERTHVFVKRGEEQERPDGTLTLDYTFVHVLYQNAFYASLTPTRRVSLSGRIAKALVARYADKVNEVAATLAVLFESARDFSSSSQFYYTAAQQAAGLFGFDEALSLAERGLKVATRLPEGPQRIQLELGLQMVRVLALRSLKGWAAPELEPVLARARALCRELGDPLEVFPVLWALILFVAIRGNLREYCEQADALMERAEASGNPAFIMGACHLVGVSREFLGDMVESSRVLERGCELHDPTQHLAYTKMYGLDPGMISRAMSSRPLFVLGYPDRALARATETLELARSQRQPMTLAFAVMVTQGVHLSRGEAAQAVALGDEVVALCNEYGLAQEREWGRSFQGSALVLLGRVDEGVALLQDSLAVQEAIGSGLVRSAFLGALADTLRVAGRVEEGLAAVRAGFAHAERTAEGGYLAELYRARGQLLHAAGEPEAAEASLREALAVASAQQAKSFELRAATALADVLAARGRTAEVGPMLGPVFEWFTEGHDTADLRAASTALAAAG